jgi:hypothetical protein
VPFYLDRSGGRDEVDVASRSALLPNVPRVCSLRPAYSLVPRRCVSARVALRGHGVRLVVLRHVRM